MSATKKTAAGDRKSGREFVDRRHGEWASHRTRWRWLLDSLEGGERYRDAIYGTDTRGMPAMNLVRHKREYPEPREVGAAIASGTHGYGTGQDATLHSTDDDFELRRARTPVPTFVPEAITTHLGKVYSKEVRRSFGDGPGDAEDPRYDALRSWMEDVDGLGTRYDDWVKESFAPLFLALGQLDLLFDHPPAPDGEAPSNRADAERLRLTRCLVSWVLPENVTWWRLDPTTRRYVEVLIRDVDDPDDPDPVYRHWDVEGARLLDEQGVEVPDSWNPHDFGMPPIVRVFDRRKSRCRNVGQSRYESIAERQREYYNRDSELILSDTTQAHPLLQGPEDYVQADGTIPIGPGWLLPKKKNTAGTSVSYEGFDVVDFPKDGAESIRRNKADIRDEADRDARLTKPAGATGTGKGTVAQSGISKVMDDLAGNEYLAGIAGSLARAERTIIEYALRVLGDVPDVSGLMAGVEVVYPTDYDLQSAQDLGEFIADFQDRLEGSGNAPEAEIIALTRYYRAALPGLDDDAYRLVDEEIRALVEAKSLARSQLAEAGPPPMPPGRAPAVGRPLIPASPDDATVAGDEQFDD